MPHAILFANYLKSNKIGKNEYIISNQSIDFSLVFTHLDVREKLNGIVKEV